MKLTFAQIVKLLLKRSEWKREDGDVIHKSGIYSYEGTSGIRFRKDGEIVYDSGYFDFMLIIILTIRLGK